MKKKLLSVLLVGVSIFSLTACNKLDIIRDRSVTSFDTVINTMKDNVSADNTFGGWSLTAPDKTTRLLWSSDYSKSGIDLMIETDAQPFIDAGLAVDKLPEGMYTGDKIVVGVNLGDEALTYDKDVTPLTSYEMIVEHYRDNLKYHGTLDHFGIDLSGGNMFEWAKDMSKNDKDMVFALNPQPFLDAGVDVNNIKGWVFAKVTTMDAHGKKIQVDRLLKPFDLDSKK